MQYIDFKTIRDLNITPGTCVEWVRESLLHKYDSVLPAKISIKLPGDIFINTMPAYLPGVRRFGVKVVSRYPERKPSLQSDLLLYDTDSGQLLALMDGLWITTMRTGAMAALSIMHLQKTNARSYGFIGLGNTARATMLCLLAVLNNAPIEVHLLHYKEQAELFMERFKDYANITFRVYNSCVDLIKESDVVVSCVTVANELFAPDEAFLPGVLVVPVHTRGFQNCDLFFDKVFADDRNHVCGFKYFDRFKQFDEFSRVLLGQNNGRESDGERILAYNIGIALHDIVFASKIAEMVMRHEPTENCMETGKFWV